MAIEPLHVSDVNQKFKQAVSLLKRLVKANKKEHWEEGETLESAWGAADNFLSDLKFERQVMTDPVAVAFTADNVCLPDLRGREHFCDHQK